MTAAVNIVHFLDIPFAGEASSHCHFPTESLESKLEGQIGTIVYYYARLIIHCLYIYMPGSLVHMQCRDWIQQVIIRFCAQLHQSVQMSSYWILLLPNHCDFNYCRFILQTSLVHHYWFHVLGVLSPCSVYGCVSTTKLPPRRGWAHDCSCNQECSIPSGKDTREFPLLPDSWFPLMWSLECSLVWYCPLPHSFLSGNTGSLIILGCWF